MDYSTWHSVNLLSFRVVMLSLQIGGTEIIMLTFGLAGAQNCIVGGFFDGRLEDFCRRSLSEEEELNEK